MENKNNIKIEENFIQLYEKQIKSAIGIVQTLAFFVIFFGVFGLIFLKEKLGGNHLYFIFIILGLIYLLLVKYMKRKSIIAFIIIIFISSIDFIEIIPEIFKGNSDLFSVVLIKCFIIYKIILGLNATIKLKNSITNPLTRS